LIGYKSHKSDYSIGLICFFDINENAIKGRRTLINRREEQILMQIRLTKRIADGVSG
jgi:hypothetical protein